jgi:hypothetical protein
MVKDMISRCIVLAAFAVASHAAHPAFAQSKVQAGVSAAVKGEIQIASLGATVGRFARSGDDIFLGDTISSGDDAGMQVLLMDETVFTIGAQSAITIDEFVYDPETGGGKVAAPVVRGAFRFVTGRIAKRQPQAMAVKLPIGSIGVRGTIVAGRVDGTSSLVVLLGPGANTDTDERLGRILVSNAGETVEISRTGFATMIEGPNAAPVEPFQLPLADLRALTQSLDQGAARGESDGNGGNAPKKAASRNTSGDKKQGGKAPTPQKTASSSGTDTRAKQSSGGSTQPAPNALTAENTQNLAGEGQVAAGQNANDPLNTNDAKKEGDKLLEDAVQGDPDTQLPPVTAGVASFDDLRRIQTGTHSFTIDTAFVQTQINGMSSNIPGTMKLRLDVDFGARALGGGASEVILDTTKGGAGNIAMRAPIPLKDYSTEVGLASKSFGNSQGDAPQISGSTVEIRNGNGVIAQTVRADIKFDDGIGNRGTGAGESAPRKP